MSVKLVIYYIHEDWARDTVRERIHALATDSKGEDKVIEVSGSTYAVATKKTAAQVMDKIKLATTPKGAYRLHVIEVTSSAAVITEGDDTAKANGGWIDVFKT